MNRSTDPLVGWVLDGRYEVTSRIARGGMATVYLATDTRLDREVAVKVMHAHLADDAAFVARFIREAKSAARISHPNVVAVYDQGQDGHSVYLVMEHVRGTTLRDVLNDVHALTPGQALDVLVPVLSALGAAHRAGMVHRDVKPENVLLADDAMDAGLDDIGHGVKVADFGLARAAAVSGNTATTGVLIGTASYLSPELVSRGVADARSDVYAAGIMLFEMLVGRPPFEGDVAVQVAFQHVNEEVPLPSEFDPGLPESLDELVDLATARDPDDRPRDAAEFARRVRAVRSKLTEAELDREPSPQAAPTVHDRATKIVEGVPRPSRSSRGPGPKGPGARPAGRQPSRFPAAGVGAGGPAPSSSPVGAAEPDVTHSHSAKRRRFGPSLIALLMVLALLGGAGGWYFTAGPGAYTTTPIVSGTEAQVTQSLTQAGFQTESVPVYDEKVPRGSVVGTDPAAGQDVRKNATVKVLVSRGTAFFTMPSLAGLPLDQATARLTQEELTLKGEPTKAYSDSVAPGSVVSTEPKAKQQLKRGDAVALVVSNGPAPVDVPDVRNKKIDAVTRTLKGLGLQVKTTEEFSDTVEKDVVMSQSIVGSGKAKRGDSISLVVSKGPELVSVPDVVGNQAAPARRALEAAGFVVREEKVLGGYFGTVRSQDPGGGSKARAGSTVTITIV